MFTVVGVTASDFDFVVTPQAAGTVNTTTGALTIADATTGAFTVKATAKASAGAVTGSPATVNFTGVTAKP